jgi:hypothetical protein
MDSVLPRCPVSSRRKQKTTGDGSPAPGLFLYEYSLFFISVLYDLNEVHPDPALVKELYPVAKKQMDCSLNMSSTA